MSMFLEKRVQKFVYDTAVDSVVKNTSVGIGWLPANAMIVGGYGNVTQVFSDADAGDDTTIAIGYTSATTALFPATACGSYTDNLPFRLLPGVMNIGSGQAITTVDTPVEAVALSRVSGDTFGILKLTAAKEVLITIGNDQNLDAGRMEIYIEYILCDE